MQRDERIPPDADYDVILDHDPFAEPDDGLMHMTVFNGPPRFVAKDRGISKEEFCHILGISPSTFDRYIKSGRIKKGVMLPDLRSVRWRESYAMQLLDAWMPAEDDTGSVSQPRPRS